MNVKEMLVFSSNQPFGSQLGSSFPAGLGVICLLLGSFFTGSTQSHPAETQEPASSSPGPRKLIRVSTSLADKTYCSSSNLRLTMSLTITNVSGNPVIVDKDYFAIVHTTISRNLGSGKPGPVEFKTGKNVLMEFSSVDESRPASELFVVLKPMEAYVTKLHDYIPIDDGHRSHAGYIKPGKFLHEGVVLTWGGPNRLGEDLRNRWKEYGVLLLDPLTTEPIEFSVEAAPKVGDCD